MILQGSYSSLRLTREQGQYRVASESTFQRCFVAFVSAVGLAVACTTKDNPLGIGITGSMTFGFGAAAGMAYSKKRRLGAQLDALGQERPGYIPMR
jgi:hypothetical protein